jgi:hypothetical protein
MSDIFDPLGPQPLGAYIPVEKPYAAKYPLLAENIEAAASKPVPVTIGVDWYSNFDRPVKIGTRYWVGKSDTLGSIRGGHCVCLRPPSMTDLSSWWERYDQGNEGACVGFGSSRMMSLLNRSFYDAPWLYHEAQKNDYWPGENYEGTSVDAAMKVLRLQGHKTPAWRTPRLLQGASAYRWTSSVDEILAVMGAEAYRAVGGIPFLNSWGRYGYPHITWMSFDTLVFLLQNGDAAVITDR